LKSNIRSIVEKASNTLLTIYFILWEGAKRFTPFKEHSMGSNWMKWRYFSQFLNIDRDLFQGIIVDIGCGSGGWTIRIAKYYPRARIIGIDASLDSIQKANQKRTEQNITNALFLIGNGVSIPLQSGAINRVITTQMYEHLSSLEQRKLLLEIDRILKVNGYLVLNTPGDLLYNYSFPVYKVLSLFPCLVKHHPLIKYFKENKRYPYEWHGHTMPGFSPSDIAQQLEGIDNLSLCQYGYALKKFDAIHFQVRSLNRNYGAVLAPLSFIFSLLDLLHNSKGLDLTCQIKKIDTFA
jgi:SAM-dependent methyltransferase